MQKLVLATMMALGAATVVPVEAWAQQQARPPSARFQQDLNSANYIMPGCRENEKRSNPFREGLCSGIVSATARYVACTPDGVTYGQMTRVVIAYVDARPARLHEDFTELASEALQEAWPCRRR